MYQEKNKFILSDRLRRTNGKKLLRWMSSDFLIRTRKKLDKTETIEKRFVSAGAAPANDDVFQHSRLGQLANAPPGAWAVADYRRRRRSCTFHGDDSCALPRRALDGLGPNAREP